MDDALYMVLVIVWYYPELAGLYMESVLLCTLWCNPTYTYRHTSVDDVLYMGLVIAWYNPTLAGLYMELAQLCNLLCNPIYIHI